MASLALSFSAVSVILALRRRPAVSKRRTLRPDHSRSLANASRVSPGSGPVIMRSSPRKALTSVDLPALGRPTMATRMGRNVGRHLLRPRSPVLTRLQAQRRQHLGHEIDQAFAVLGRDGDRLAEAQLESGVEALLPTRPSHLLATTIGRPEARTSLANNLSLGVMPSRASIRNSTRSASPAPSRSAGACARRSIRV